MIALTAKYGAKAVESQRPYYAREGKTFAPNGKAVSGSRWSVLGTNPDHEQIAGNFSVLLNSKTGCVEATQIDL